MATMADSGWALVVNDPPPNEPFVDEIININEIRPQDSSRLGWASGVEGAAGTSSPMRVAPSPFAGSILGPDRRQDAVAGPEPPKRRSLRKRFKSWLRRVNPFMSSKKAKGMERQDQVVLPPTLDEEVPAGRKSSAGSSMLLHVLSPFTSGSKSKVEETEEEVSDSMRISTLDPLVHYPKPTSRAVKMPETVPSTSAPIPISLSHEPRRRSQLPPVTSQTRRPYPAQPLYSSQYPYPPQSSPANLTPSLQSMRTATTIEVAPSRSRNVSADGTGSNCVVPQSASSTWHACLGENTEVRKASSSSQVKVRPLPQPPTKTERTPPLFSKITALVARKDSTPEIIRSKINYLRFEMGYGGIRFSPRGDGNSFYLSFAFAYLEQIYTASDRGAAVDSALKHLETAQRLVDQAMPSDELSNQTYTRLRDVVQEMKKDTTTRQMVTETLQYQPYLDDVAGYMQTLAAVYVRLAPGMQGSEFQQSDLSTGAPLSSHGPVSAANLGLDIDDRYISGLSRILNVPVQIYRVDAVYDATVPRERHILPDCAHFMPTGLPVVAEPVALLFRPGHYEILVRGGPPR